MKYYFLSIITVLTILLVISGCSKLQDNITPPPMLSLHQQGNNDTTSIEFHGNMLKANNFDLSSCQQCHAADFSGGITKVACNSCHTYPHTPGFSDTTSTSFHGLYLRANNFNMDNCQNCHGSDFSGNGAAKANCKTCHTQDAGPLACNTCHGTFNDQTRIAPPRDPAGNTSTDVITVGAHTSHLYGNAISVVACENCHKVPNSTNVKDHFTLVPHTIVVLDSLAIHGQISNAAFNSGSGTCANTYCHGNFQFKKSDAPATNYYAFDSNYSVMSGNNRTVTWTQLDGSQAPCGSCHGTPDGFISPVGHIKVSRFQCVACHSTVVDANGNIIDKTKHINGQINYALSK